MLNIKSTNNDQIKFKEIVVGLGDMIISNSTFQKTYFSTINLNNTGEYKMTVINTDKTINNTSSYIFFGILPYFSDNGELNVNSFAGLLIGILFFIMGLISLTIGTIFSSKIGICKIIEIIFPDKELKKNKYKKLIIF
jgi:hypothetical protein